MNYIKRGDNPQPGGCVFCAIAAAEHSHDAENLILYRGETCFVVMNLYPYNTAHLMVLPYQHTSDMPGLCATVAQELFSLTQRCVRILGEAYAPHGYNIGMNLGSIAGAGIAEHLHMHIVPRWSGDTNFMPIIGGTKLIPEDLDGTYQHLLPAFR
ncbi:histidine triad (HIT) protein [Oscillochloris trichoides DG-6]|uniref:Histidine triad (HIT) protein n=1 Tax=Oscillochloris trichoides DG-6 TaxID=765420 RepID=E1IEJ7_9CHLR|nr:histidine triad (HIT) protein [Oscillochloris trichoides DG-6]